MMSAGALALSHLGTEIMTCGQQKVILIVDDEADIRLLLEDILGLRYQVKTAADGLEALDLIERSPEAIDLVLTDLRMPRMDGMELLRALQADHPGLGVMMISAHGTVSEAVRAMRGGIFDYITKPLPLDFNEVYAKIDRYFEMRDLKRQQEQLHKQILDLSYFPRSDPNFLARAIPIERDVLLYPGNRRTASFLHEHGGIADAESGLVRYSQGGISRLFPEDFPDLIGRIMGTDEVIEVSRVQAGDRYYQHTYSPFVENRNEIFLAMVDITRQVENEQLRMMLEAGMEHEFKNHLMLISPMAEMLHQELLGPLSDEQKRAAAQIIEGGSLLLSSLTERLEFSRAYSGHLDLKKTPVDIYDLIGEVYRSFPHLPSHTLRIGGEPMGPEKEDQPQALVHCDRQYLKRVVTNLVSNGLKHAGAVDTAVETTDDEILISVIDQGEGMEEEDSRGIWTLGYRAKNRKGKSTGIGLPYSKLIVEAHGGRIGVETALGKGSRFFFSLPASRRGRAA